MDQTDQIVSELKDWVKLRRGNQSMVGRALGVSKQAVSGWIKGLARPSFDTGLKLAVFLKSHRSASK
jgi:transcriptional regulator with XRE-family HTH domain